MSMKSVDFCFAMVMKCCITPIGFKKPGNALIDTQFKTCQNYRVFFEFPLAIIKIHCILSKGNK